MSDQYYSTTTSQGQASDPGHRITAAGLWRGPGQWPLNVATPVPWTNKDDEYPCRGAADGASAWEIWYWQQGYKHTYDDVLTRINMLGLSIPSVELLSEAEKQTLVTEHFALRAFTTKWPIIQKSFPNRKTRTLQNAYQRYSEGRNPLKLPVKPSWAWSKGALAESASDVGRGMPPASAEPPRPY